ncbi:Glycosyl transferases group 1 [uncultured archaeon]|nr:Glycosyl transferases group 1 [uncultured archaeon]
MQEIDYLIVTENATRGQEIYTDQRKTMLEELGYSVRIIQFDTPKVRISLDMLRIAYIFRKNLEKYLRTVKPRIIEFYCPATIILQDNKLLKNYKIIASFDVPFGVNILNFGSKILHNLEKQKFCDADLIFSLTKYGADHLQHKYMILDKVVHLPYVLHPEELNANIISDGGYAVSYCPAGRENKKGLDILIEAWNYLGTERKLIIMGTDEKKAIKYLHKKNVALPGNVEFIPSLPREKILTLLSSSSFFISASRFEEFGQIIIEVLSLGKPVVSTPTKGPKEFLYELDKKLISPTFAPSDLAGSIKYCEENLNNENLKKAIVSFIKNYDYESIKNKLNKEITVLLTGDSVDNR